MHVNRLPGGEEKESVPEENLLRNNGRKLSQFVKRQKPTYSRSSENPIQDKQKEIYPQGCYYQPTES